MTKIKLQVRKSNKYIYAQLIDPKTGNAISGVRGKDPEVVGSEVANLAKKDKFSEAIFDRGNNRYHGQVKKLADAARKGGLKF